MDFNLSFLYGDEGTDAPEVEIEEAKELAVLILAKYGYDFTNYAISSFKRRLLSFMKKFNIKDVPTLKRKILESEKFFLTFINEITVNTTELFRDPEVWRALVEKAFPILKSRGEIDVWHAACSSGEEVLSMSIAAREHGLEDNIKSVHATDINSNMLEIARSATYPLRYWDSFVSNYKLYNPQGDLRQYCKIKKGNIYFDKTLISKVNFYHHDLVVDEMKNQFDLIFCRNVMIYFNPMLQDQVIRLLYNSLKPGGILVIGSKESLIWSSLIDRFEGISDYERIYRKI